MEQAGAGTRERILTATTTLLRRQGYAATGLQEIAGQSGARIGSIYHFFDGKQALAEESIRTSGAAYGAMVLGLLRDGPTDPAAAIRAVFAQAAADLAATDYADACPIATVALEVASTNDALRQATADVFTAWIGDMTAWCDSFVDNPEDARDLAITTLTALQGVFILARAQRSPEPLLAAGRSISQLVGADTPPLTSPTEPRLGAVSRNLAVAVAQPETAPHDIAANAIRHGEAIATAGARLVVFPELSLTGYELDAKPVDLDDAWLDPIAEACAQTGAVALVGAPVQESTGAHIAMIRFEGDSRAVVYRKQMLSNNEARLFAPGPCAKVIDVDGWRVGLGICRDTGQPLHIAAIARMGIDLYAAGVVNRPEELEEQDARGFLLARACGSYVAFAGFAGPTGGEFSETLGTSAIWSPDGVPMARAGEQPGEVVAAELPPR